RTSEDRKQPESRDRETRLEGGALRRRARRSSPLRLPYFVKSAAVGGPSIQFTSHAPSTVMNVNEFAGSHASCTILAGIEFNPPGLNLARLSSPASTAFSEIMVCDSLAVCQCFRTWIAFDVRMRRLVACVFGST